MTIDDLERRIQQVPGVLKTEQGKDGVDGTIIHIHCGDNWKMALVEQCVDLKWDFIEATDGKMLIDIDVRF